MQAKTKSQIAVWYRTYIFGVAINTSDFTHGSIRTLEYADVGKGLYAYIFLVCEQRKFGFEVKYRSVQILQRFLKAKNQ